MKNTAVEKFLDGYNCAQAVIYSACDDIGLDKHTALKISCGLGAGLGREQEVCGAVTGGVLAIGFKYGRGENEEKQKTEDTYTQTRQFIHDFKDRHGTLLCRELLDCDLTTLEGREQFKEKELLKKTCAKCVETAALLIKNI